MVVDTSKMTTLWVWYLVKPQAPHRVGAVSLTPALNRCSFRYDPDWATDGFALSPDMPLGNKPIMPPTALSVPGALDDAMPDRWGQNAIRVVDRPPRMSPLDFLYYAGDRRFGALGISSEPDTYRPYPDHPLLTSGSLDEANEVIQRLILKQPLNERERDFLRTSRSMGGAHPKMLIDIDGEEWLAKFPKGDPVDLPLVEHATMELARGLGIRVPDSRCQRIPTGHIVMTRRFDRAKGRRLHALSARTMLLESGESYGALAAVIRAIPPPDLVSPRRKEIFRRMVFNMLIDNTDDHSKNHAFIRLPSGHFDLAPAYDILPQMSGLGRQAMPISCGRSEDDFATAIAECSQFGLHTDEAIEEWRRIARGVSGWREIFSGVGVSGVDIDYLSGFLDSEDKLAMRRCGGAPT